MNRYEHFIRLTIDDEVLIVSPVGVFDAERLEELREAVAAARRLGFARIAIDFAAAEFTGAGAVSTGTFSTGDGMPQVDFAGVEWRNMPHVALVGQSRVEAHDWPRGIETMPASLN